MDSTEALSMASGLSRDEVRKIADQVFENRDKLQACPGPHRFTIPAGRRKFADDIYFATKCPMDSTTAYSDKMKWVDLFFPFIGREKVIAIRNKGLLDGHVLIDDDPRNFENFNGKCLLFDQPWNREDQKMKVTRCKGWEEVFYEIAKVEVFAENSFGVFGHKLIQ